jgi:hypothetical protein
MVNLAACIYKWIVLNIGAICTDEDYQEIGRCWSFRLVVIVICKLRFLFRLGRNFLRNRLLERLEHWFRGLFFFLVGNEI